MLLNGQASAITTVLNSKTLSLLQQKACLPGARYLDCHRTYTLRSAGALSADGNHPIPSASGNFRLGELYRRKEAT